MSASAHNAVHKFLYSQGITTGGMMMVGSPGAHSLGSFPMKPPQGPDSVLTFPDNNTTWNSELFLYAQILSKR